MDSSYPQLAPALTCTIPPESYTFVQGDHLPLLVQPLLLPRRQTVPRLMRLNPQMPIGLQARVVAQSIVRHGFDMKRVVSELRPDIKCRGPYGAKLLDDPVVRREIEVIMNRTERGVQK